MARRRGVVITGIMLAAVTGASFAVWLVPQGPASTFVVSDHRAYLDGSAGIHEILQESVRMEYGRLLAGESSPAEYDGVAGATSSQVAAQIGELVASGPPEEWQPSYISHMEAMRKFNEYVTETRAVASMIAEGRPAAEIEAASEAAEQIRSESLALAAESAGLRPR